ncbi:S8 family serine peptidase [Candidatus Micrarchaeota archaeon]|nr:S8 family serine peptidase [Candidatus Micrarchaeota archaeon]
MVIFSLFIFGCVFFGNPDKTGQKNDNETQKNITNLTTSPIKDLDNDGVADDLDNCPTIYNPGQGDKDQDSKGDLCDVNLFIRNFVYDPVSEQQKIQIAPELITAKESGYYILQYSSGKGEIVANALTKFGAQIIGFVPDDALLIYAKKTKSELESIEGVRYVDIYQPAYKLDPKLYERFTKGNPSDPNEKIAIEVRVFGNIEKVEIEIEALGGKVSRLYEKGDPHYGSGLNVTISGTKIVEIAKMDEVADIKIFVPETLRMDTAPAITGVRSAPNGPPFMGLTGSGEIIGIRDTGLDSGNESTLKIDIKGRVINVSPNYQDANGHGTHVVGIAAGNGSLSGALGIRGAAPKATIVFRPANAGGSVSQILSSEYRLGARVFSNSWGWDDGLNYDQNEVDADNFTYLNPDSLVLFASTNRGPVIGLGTPDVAKNILTVGASENRNPPGYPAPGCGNRCDNINDWSGFTGIGPSSDGRIKPDVLAPGTAIDSLQSSLAPAGWCNPPDSGQDARNPNYVFCTGASMATPHVAGIAALIRQYLGLVKATPNPSGALIKAFIINGAIDMDDSRNTGPIPGNREGWGRVNITNSLAPQNNTNLVNFADANKFTANGQEYKINNIRFSSSKPITITLAYYDPPGAIGASAIINDLDLELVSPSGKIFRAGAPSFLNGQSRPNGPKDSINNVEKLIIKKPEDGFYNLTIRAATIAPTTSAQFAVVYSQTVGIDPANADDEYKTAYEATVSKSEDVYAKGNGFKNNEDLWLYIIKHQEGEFPNNAKLDDVTGNVEKITIPQGGNITAKLSGKIWASPSNWIYYKNGDGHYNIVIDRNGDGIYDNQTEIIDYSNKSGFRVNGVAATDSKENSKKIFTSSDKAVYAFGGGFENDSTVYAYITNEQKGNYNNAIYRKILSTNKSGGFITGMESSPANYLYAGDKDSKTGKYFLNIYSDFSKKIEESDDETDLVRINELKEWVGKGNGVKAGDSGPAVRQLQEFLNAYGFKATVNSQFDKETKDALNHYLKSRELEEDGSLDKSDFSKIEEDVKVSFSVRAVAITNKDGQSARVFNKGEKMYAKGAGFFSKEKIRLYLIKHVENLEENATLVDVTDNGYDSVSVDGAGAFEKMELWKAKSLGPGKYDLVADENEDGKFQNSTDTIDQVGLFALNATGGNVIGDAEAAEELQIFLKTFARSELEINKKFDQKTKNALKDYKNSKGLEVNEELDDKTLESIAKDAAISARVQEVESSDDSGKIKDRFSVVSLGISEVVYSYGEGFVPSKKVSIYVVKHKGEWKNGDILTDEAGGAKEVRTNQNGEIENKELWNYLKEENTGDYDIIVDTDQSGTYTDLPSIKDGIDTIKKIGFRIGGTKLCTQRWEKLNMTEATWEELATNNIPFTCSVGVTQDEEGFPRAYDLYVHGNEYVEILHIDSQEGFNRGEIYRKGIVYDAYMEGLGYRDPAYESCNWFSGDKTPEDAPFLGTLPHTYITIIEEMSGITNYPEVTVECNCADLDDGQLEPWGQVCKEPEAAIGHTVGWG